MKLLNIFIVCVVLNSTHSFSQDEYQELIITDTSIFNGKKIYVFNDNSWAYAYKIKNINDYILKNSTEELIKDTSQLFSFNWLINKSHINTYRLSGLKDSFLIELLPAEHNKCVAPIKTNKLKITSTFKIRWNKWHKGIDIGVGVGNKVSAVFDGKVRYAKFNSGGYGNLIIIRHYNGLETYYAHLDKINVVPGQHVNAGSIIGLSGNTGHSTGPHLHFEVRIFGNAFNPYYLWNSEFSLIVKQKYINSDMFYHQRKSSTVDSQALSGKTKTKTTIKSTNTGTKKRRNVNSTYGNLDND